MSMNTSTPIATPRSGIVIEGLRKVYGQGDQAVEALKDVNMTVNAGEVIGFLGPSGDWSQQHGSEQGAASTTESDAKR